MIGGGGGPKSYTMKLQGGQNVRIFFYPKIERIVRIFFKLYGLYGFLSWKCTGFFLIISATFSWKFQKKNSGQNEVSLTFFLHSKQY